MQPVIPLLFAAVVGMGHAFEPDHLLAVSTLVTRHDRLRPALRDGLLWGLGHTTMLVLVGSVIIFSRATWLPSGYFEAAVGVMLVALGISRLLDKNSYQSFQKPKQQAGIAYTIGLVHGLAGSGALVLAVLGAIRQPAGAVAYILLFGLGSVLGMLAAVGLMHLPFTQRMRLGRRLRASAVVLSSALSAGYGGWMVYSNLRLPSVCCPLHDVPLLLIPHYIGYYVRIHTHQQHPPHVVHRRDQRLGAAAPRAQYPLGQRGKFTGRYQASLLVYFKPCNDPAQAIAREKEIKG